MCDALSFRKFVARDEFDIKPDGTSKGNFSVVGAFSWSTHKNETRFSTVNRVTRKDDGKEYALKVSFLVEGHSKPGRTALLYN